MTWQQDLRYASRALRKSPGFATVAILTLALGVGASTALFSVINTVMLRPLPFVEPDSLVRIWENSLERQLLTFSFSHPNYLDFRSQSRTMQSMAAWVSSGVTWTTPSEAEVVPGLEVTFTFLPTLKVTPVLGRNFREDEDRPGGNIRVVIVSDGFWRRALGADANVLGRTLTLNSQPYTVVGVLPPSFRWGNRTDLLTPLAPNPARSRADHRLAAIGRLAEGVTLERARTEFETLASGLAQQYPASNKGWSITMRSVYDWLVPETTRQSLLILLGAVGLVLLIACGNVVNLLLARSAARQRELSIRAALGASRLRVTRQLLLECALIAIGAALVGVAIAYGATQVLAAFGPASVPRLDELSIDVRVFAFALGVSLVTMVVFGLLPALHAARRNPQEALRMDSRGSTSGIGGRRVRSVLTVAEVALSVALLIGAGLLIRSFSQVQQVQPGFSTGGLMTARLSLPNSTYEGGAPKWAFQQRLLTDLRGRPGVSAAAVASGPPLTGSFTSGDVRLPTQTNEQALSTNWRLVSPGYFAALGIPLRGREFTPADGEKSLRVAIISAALAERYFPNQDPIGRAIVMRSFGDEEQTIIGVAGDVKSFGLEQDAGFVFYGSTSQYTGWNPMTLLWRAAGDTAASVDTVRAAIRSIDAGVPISDVASMETLFERSLGPRRFNVYLLAAFAVVAVALATIGLFGVMAYLVSQRTREIGVRLALGATRSEVFRAVLGRGLLLAGIGAVVGVTAASFLTRVMESWLFSISRTDPVTFVAVPLALTAIAALACWIPARRAMRVDPVVALRAE
jgi:putative ABC transport system permease protein